MRSEQHKTVDFMHNHHVGAMQLFIQAGILNAQFDHNIVSYSYEFI